MKKLGLHSHVMPAFELIRAAYRHSGTPHRDQTQFFSAFTAEDMLDHFLGDVTIFDCRGIPIEFIDDTGAAAFEEMEQTRQWVRLPFADCYFEMSDATGIIALGRTTYQHGEPVDDDDGNDSVEVGEIPCWRGMSIDAYARTIPSHFGSFDNWTDFEGNPTDVFFHGMNAPLHTDDSAPLFANTWRAAKRMLGVLTLLNDKLLIDEVRPDPAPRLTRARLERGKLPVSAPTHFLTVNVGAVRRASAATKLGTHESPALHWRRGHWRMLHRGSEFETRAWVRRCLVGDPDKGYVGHRDYRLVHRPPMIVAPTTPTLQ